MSFLIMRSFQYKVTKVSYLNGKALESIQSRSLPTEGQRSNAEYVGLP